MRQTHPPALQRPRPEQPDWTNAARWYHGGRRRAGREGGQGVHALGLGVGRPLSRRRRRWQWRRPFSPYVAIKCEARSPTRWLAGWLARYFSLPFSGIPPPQQNRRKVPRAAAGGGGREGAGHSRGTVTFSDCRKHFARSIVVRRSFVKATLVRRPSASAPRRRRGRPLVPWPLRLRCCRAACVAVLSHGGVVDYANSTGSGTRERSSGRGH